MSTENPTSPEATAHPSVDAAVAGYVPPSVTDLGSLSDLTRGGGGDGIDGTGPTLGSA